MLCGCLAAKQGQPTTKALRITMIFLWLFSVNLLSNIFAVQEETRTTNPIEKTLKTHGHFELSSQVCLGLSHRMLWFVHKTHANFEDVGSE